MGVAAAGQDCSGRSTSPPLLTPKSQGQEDRLECVPEPLDLFFPMWLHGNRPPPLMLLPFLIYFVGVLKTGGPA